MSLGPGVGMNMDQVNSESTLISQHCVPLAAEQLCEAPAFGRRKRVVYGPCVLCKEGKVGW